MFKKLKENYIRKQNEEIDKMINDPEFIKKCKKENEEVEKIRKIMNDPKSTKLDKMTVKLNNPLYKKKTIGEDWEKGKTVGKIIGSILNLFYHCS